MKHQYVFLIFIIFIINNTIISAQQNEDEENILLNRLFEENAEISENIQDYGIYERMDYLKNHKIDINKATKEEFSEIPFLNINQINDIIDYREKNGNFVSLYELQAIKSISSDLVLQLIPYLKIEDNPPIELINKKEFDNDLFIYTSHSLKSNEPIITDKDTIDNSYSFLKPNTYHTRLRYMSNYKNILVNVSAENDAGESYFTNKNKTFDFVSACVFYKSKKILKNLLVGDYYANLGQGLVLWNGFFPRYASYSSNIYRPHRVIRPYTSFDENNFLRGIAITLNFKKIDISIFNSIKKRDANIGKVDSTGKILNVSSLINTGLHILPSEMKYEDVLTEKTTALNVHYNNKSYEFGINFLNTYYDIPLKKNDELYNYYCFSGKKINVASIYYRYDRRFYYVFGEAAENINGGFATINGLCMFPASFCSFTTLYRYYSEKYYSPYSNAIGYNSFNNNEKGFYTGIEINPSSKLNISASADFMKIIWLKYQISQPDMPIITYLLNINYSLSNKTNMNFSYSYNNRFKDNNMIDNPIYDVIPEKNYKIKYGIIHNSTENLILRTRIEYSSYFKNNSSDGMMIYQDIIYKLNKKASIENRICGFKTKDYNSRIYMYENNSLMSHSISFYYGNGLRYYLILKLFPINKLYLWLRYSITRYLDYTSPNDNTNTANNKSEISIYLKYNF